MDRAAAATAASEIFMGVFLLGGALMEDGRTPHVRNTRSGDGNVAKTIPSITRPRLVVAFWQRPPGGAPPTLPTRVKGRENRPRDWSTVARPIGHRGNRTGS